MKTINTTSVLFLHDKTPICCYCGTKLSVEHKKEWNDRDLDEWYEYECNCKSWNDAIEMDKSLNLINDELYNGLCQYQKDYQRILKQYGLKSSVHMYMSLK